MPRIYQILLEAGYIFIGGVVVTILVIYGYFRVIKKRSQEGHARRLAFMVVLSCVTFYAGCGPRLPASPYIYSTEYLTLQQLIQEHYEDGLEYGITLEQPVDGEIGRQMKKLKIDCLQYVDATNIIQPGLQGFLLTRYADIPSWWQDRAVLLYNGEFSPWQSTTDNLRPSLYQSGNDLFSKLRCTSTFGG
ncbi:MAG: hypothetical protein AAF564_15525 [Bacteroidota bacterium]